MTIGFIASGKSTLANRLQKDLSINNIDGDTFRSFIKESIPYYNDLDISYPNPKAKDISFLTNIYRRNICRKLLEKGQPVIHSGNNLSRETRKAIISDVTMSSPDTQIIFIELCIEESELIERLRARDQDNPGNRWVKHYNDIKKKEYQPPLEKECDNLLHYKQDNYIEIRDFIKSILSN